MLWNKFHKKTLASQENIETTEISRVEQLVFGFRSYRA